MSDSKGKSPFHNPFAALADRRSQLSEGKAPQPAAAPAGPTRAVVRLERKGRGGKEVTVIEQLALSSHERERWLKALKQSLGCGGAVENEALVLQGDHRERVEVLLRQRGVKRISMG